LAIEGDARAVEVHVDECIALASRAEQARRDHDDGVREYEVNGEMRVRVTDLVGFQGKIVKPLISLACTHNDERHRIRSSQRRFS
jgi:hypothetical protein